MSDVASAEIKVLTSRGVVYLSMLQAYSRVDAVAESEVPL